MENKYSDIQLLIIEEYKKFADRIGKTPSQKDLKDERKFNNPNWIVTIHKINLYFNGLFELNKICNLENHTKIKRISKNKRTHEEFVAEVEKIVPNKYEFLTEYLGSEKEITIKCKHDGYTWTIGANGFLSNGCKCPKCSNSVQNKDTEYFKKEVEELYPNQEYLVVGEYTGARNKILIQHNTKECNNIFPVTPDGFLHKETGCPKCNNRKAADKLFLTQDEFVRRVKDLFGNEYKILSKYKGRTEYVFVRHEKCGKEYWQQAGDILQGKRCRFCYGKIKKSQEKFEEEIFNLYNGEYTVLGEYINASTNILIRHNKCGREWEVSPNGILSGHGCNCSNISAGEKTVQNFLEFNKLKYKYQYRIKECKYINPLPFDFAVFKDKQLICLIEYDGRQHYEPLAQYGGEEAFLKTKIRDGIKNTYCENNSINLIRVPYWEDNNINVILQNKLIKLFNNLVIPNKNVLTWSKNKEIELIEFLDTLPNGIYSKSWIKEKIHIDNNNHGLLSKILKKDIVINYMQNKNVVINKNYITLISSCTNYEEYFELISEFKYNDKIIKIIKILYNIPVGQFYKREIIGFDTLQGNIFAKSYLENNFMRQFLLDNNIVVTSYYVRKGIDCI